ncbi:MAG: 50S ribosomal protein L17 [Anaerolineae bacterium]|jgi:large subunit ribosomal protein L17|uniref:50S ribosomal protein L17 n=1 Tax=Candidatus Flexifilum breve TaxID=3140694 RepID=UPI001AD29A17|nr:50S ribosomal protein L17 [Chloroflexota bacterium]MBK9748625.1 50S ribosomal protein L17 [Chloroflexota bacterium]MBN8634474.1 50S ribosomal protein L17 [Anaerolineae bacterium]
MRHRVSGKKLGRDTEQRRALARSLTMALIEHGRIETTQAKADFVRAHVEKLITVAKRGLASDNPAYTVHTRRLAASRLFNDRDMVTKLFEIAARSKDRPGGYLRIIKLGPRKGDAAPMVLLELVDQPSS